MEPQTAQKVFVIGFHKTGLTSAGKALEMLGYHVCHRAKPLRETLGHEQMISQLKDKSYSEIFNVASSFSAFHDNPWFWLYREMDAAFPGSKFILTIRDSESWLSSAKNYFKDSESDFRELIYGKASIAGNESLYLARYQQHNDEVRKWFQNRTDAFMEWNLVEYPAWKPLCSFLNKPIPSIQFPHENAHQTGLKEFLKKKLKWK